tara:strand:+ start:177 stop:1286 length:1110 start_codon:yes stop_codon:yes gene_type:complete
MNKKKFQTFFDCGFSKIRAGILSNDNQNEAFYSESEFFTNHSNLESKIQKIIASFEKDTNEYIDNVNLVLDSSKMLSIGISIFKKHDGSEIKKANIQFLVQEAKQQILKHYANYNIAHIIINNYKIDGVDYSYLPDKISSHFISLDILFICLPIDLVLYFKNIFSRSNISINQIICSSYAKSISYKDNLNFNGHVSFIDIGFNRTSIISYLNDKILSFDVLPIGGNNITKDIAKVLNLNLEEAENLKLYFDKDLKYLKSKKISLDLIQQIIFARIEEILELCTKSIKLNLTMLNQPKMILIGDGSKIFDNKFKEKIFLTNDIDLLEETTEDICQSAVKLASGLNKQEVIIIPKKSLKKGFFEKLFHIFQ